MACFPKCHDQSEPTVASGQLVISQTPSLIELVEQTNFTFCTFLIRLEIAELAITSYSQLQLVVASGQLVISYTPSLIVVAEYTNFPFYTFLIRLEIAELAIASNRQLQLVIASGQLVDSDQLVSQLDQFG